VTLVEFTPTAAHRHRGSHCTDRRPTTAVSTNGQSPPLAPYNTSPSDPRRAHRNTTPQTASSAQAWRPTTDINADTTAMATHRPRRPRLDSTTQHFPFTGGFTPEHAWRAGCDDATGTAPAICAQLQTTATTARYPSPLSLVCPFLFLFLHPVGIL